MQVWESAPCCLRSCYSLLRASRACSRVRSMLELKNVSKRFGGVVATDDITLDVKRGEVHALIGPNGAGKTTLIGQISGSLGSDSGEIRSEERRVGKERRE